MPHLKLIVLSLRYSSWSMRPWLALTHAGAVFDVETVALPHLQRQGDDGTHGLAKLEPTSLSERRALGSVHGLFPVLQIDGIPVHESLAICEYVAESFPSAALWPDDAIERTRARAICAEMVSGFTSMRAEMSSHLFARVPGFVPSPAARANIERIFEIWSESLSRSGGPFLFGRFSVADAMYFPVLGRLRTYGIVLPDALLPYARMLDAAPAVAQLVALARGAPRVPVYDDYIRGLGGDPDAALAA